MWLRLGSNAQQRPRRRLREGERSKGTATTERIARHSAGTPFFTPAEFASELANGGNAPRWTLHDVQQATQRLHVEWLYEVVIEPRLRGTTTIILLTPAG
jgi:hypothetical protein